MYSNAIKFTDRSGKIRLSIEKIKKSDSSQDWIVISVKDSGLGIQDKDQNKLFKMFGSIKDEKLKVNT